MILKEFNRILTERNLLDQIELFGCSHLGGHKFAGTMVIYPAGIWYGRVKACHVEQIIEDTCLKGQIIKEIYRGTMNAPTDSQPTLNW